MGVIINPRTDRPFIEDQSSTRSPARQHARELRASYDAASISHDLRKVWINADGLSADAANSPTVRYTLRSRARYEAANNSYCAGMIQTLANDLVGWGPTLLCQIPGEDAVNDLVEREFWRWCLAINFARKLRTAKIAKTADGESFGVFGVNRAIKRSPVKLTINLFEADQFATPDLWSGDPRAVDGIRFDEDGNPIEYHRLRYHPGSPFATNDYDRLPADQVLHWFRQDRPGQHRGIPEYTPALNLYAYMRRYTLAEVQTAELQAEYTGVLSGAAANDGDTPGGDGEPFDLLEVVRGMIMTTPNGTKFEQLEATHPSTTYAEFKRELLNEIARCLNIPFNIAACNSSNYNYSSGRLDHQTYFKSLEVEQDDCEIEILDRVLAEWIEHASLIWPAILLLKDDILDPANHEWMWPGSEHVDPEKESNAQDTDLRNHTLTYKRAYARRGLYWKRELRQKAAEEQFMRDEGLGVPADKSAPAKSSPEEPPASPATRQKAGKS